MLTTTGAFSGFSIDDPARVVPFYREVLGLEVRDAGMQGLQRLELGGGTTVLVYPKGDGHVPSEYTVLNLTVADIDAAADELEAAGVALLRYPDSGQDDRGIMRSTDPAEGPSIAWFEDPAGNIFSIIED